MAESFTTLCGIICQFHGYRVVEGEPKVCSACERVRVTRPAEHYSDLDKLAWYRSGGFIRPSTKRAAKPNETHRCQEFEREYGTGRDDG